MASTRRGGGVEHRSEHDPIGLTTSYTPDRPRRHICFGGEAKLRSGVAGLEVDSNGLLWLHHKPGLGGAEVGSSGIYRVAGADAAALVKAEEAQLRDFLVVAGVPAMVGGHERNRGKNH